jgi:glutathione synthase
MSETDNFIKNFLEISKKANASPYKQTKQLGIFRNDFMIDKMKKFIYQIEINTIAASMGTFSDGVKKFYSYFSRKYPEYFEYYLNLYSNDSSCLPLEKENLVSAIAESMCEATRVFNADILKSLVVFIVQEGERNLFEQRSLENLLWEK